MHDSIPVALINLNDDERIFLKKGEILGCLEPSPIEITEIVKKKKRKKKKNIVTWVRKMRKIMSLYPWRRNV